MSHQMEKAIKLWENMEKAALEMDREATCLAAHDYGLACGFYLQYTDDRRIEPEEIRELVGQERWDTLEDLDAKIGCWLEEGDN